MQKRAEKTKDKILKTAIKLFASKGLNGTTVDDIAAKAGANKQRIYAYFGSKHKLFEASLAAIFRKINEKDQVLLELKENQTAVMTEKILRYYLEIHEKNPDFRRLLAWANLESESFVQNLENIKEPALSHLKKLYAAGQHQGTFSKEISFEVYIFNLFAISYFYYANRKTLCSSLGEGLFSPEGREKLIDESVKLLSNGLIREV